MSVWGIHDKVELLQEPRVPSRQSGAAACACCPKKCATCHSHDESDLKTPFVPLSCTRPFVPTPCPHLTAVCLLLVAVLHRCACFIVSNGGPLGPCFCNGTAFRLKGVDLWRRGCQASRLHCVSGGGSGAVVIRSVSEYPRSVDHAPRRGSSRAVRLCAAE